ncbi:hypothetical protein CUJ83_11780 [Methanocella sp. CWC-04]|uniref:Uncharacterized protein n=1 Tax=Methanooceanicella nereidis TaxID=2052831 RepID=A0AAP2W6V0_9EURY|nr:hypothetical protein [Methanocella sp. CWC-04]
MAGRPVMNHISIFVDIAIAHSYFHTMEKFIFLFIKPAFYVSILPEAVPAGMCRVNDSRKLIF